MPSVYTIDGAGGKKRKRKRRRSSGAQAAAQRRFARAAAECKGQPLGDFRACMRDQLNR